MLCQNTCKTRDGSNWAEFRSNAVPFRQPNAQMFPFLTVNSYSEIRPYVTTYICNKCGRIEETLLGPILALLQEMRVRNNPSPVSQFFILLQNFSHFSRSNTEYRNFSHFSINNREYRVLQPSLLVVAMTTINQFNSDIFFLFPKTIVHNVSLYMHMNRIASTS